MYQELQGACAAAVRRAGQYIQEAVRAGSVRWDEKQRADYVSEVDTRAEELIREVLLERFPGCEVLGEELSPPNQPLSGELTFVVDPLDGTTNFLHRYPVYAVSVAALLGGQLVAAAVLDVPRDELFTAAQGGGAQCNGVPVRVSSVAEASHALVGTGFPFKHRDLFDRYHAQLARVMRAAAGIRRAGSAALDLCAVAAGRFDAFWELRLAPWDMAAGILLIREAGGLVSDLEGRPLEPRHGEVVASNGLLHSWLLELLLLA
jgi:myo-inositol-1(or 4)-monophosphatase